MCVVAVIFPFTHAKDKKFGACVDTILKVVTGSLTSVFSLISAFCFSVCLHL